MKLNQQLINEQTEHENEFCRVLDSNKKLKTEMISMEQTIETLKSECEACKSLLIKYQTEQSQFEKNCFEKNELVQQVQRLTDKMIKMEENDHINSTKQSELSTQIQRLELEKQEMLTLVQNKDRIIKNFTDNNNLTRTTCDIKRELESIRAELRFKNAELKVFRKTNKIRNKSSLSMTSYRKNDNDNELQDLYKKYNDLVKNSEIDLATLEKNSEQLKTKVKTLEQTCKSIRKSYDDLNILYYRNEGEKEKLSLTLAEMELILQETEEKNTDNKNTRRPPLKDSHAETRNKNTIIIGDECIQGLGQQLHNKYENLDICCHTYAHAPVDFLFSKAEQIAVTQKPKTIVLLTRRVGIRNAKKYIDAVTNLIKTLKENRVKLICPNITYKKYTDPQDNIINNFIYKHNMRLHNSCQYEKDIEILNLSSLDIKTSANQFKRIITQYIGTHMKHIKPTKNMNESFLQSRQT